MKRALIGLVLSVVALLIAARNIRTEDLAALQEQPVPWAYALLGGVVLMAAVIMRGFRLKLLLPAKDPISSSVLVGSTAIMFLVNNLFPGRAGELVRVVLVRRASVSALPTILTSMILERCMDALTLVAIVLCAVFALDISPDLSDWALRVGALVGLAICCVFALEVGYRHDPGRVHAWLERVLRGRLGTRIRILLEQILSGLNLAESPLRLLAIVATSAATWLITSAAFYVVLLGYSELPHTPWAGPIVAGAVAFASSIPAAPGYLGVFQLTVKESLLALNVNEVIALHYALLLWAMNWLSNNLLGIYYALRMGVGWSDLRPQTPPSVSGAQE